MFSKQAITLRWILEASFLDPPSAVDEDDSNDVHYSSQTFSSTTILPYTVSVLIKLRHISSRQDKIQHIG